MRTSASNLGSGWKISLPICLPSNRLPWRYTSSFGSRQNTTVELLLVTLLLSLLYALDDAVPCYNHSDRYESYGRTIGRGESELVMAAPWTPGETIVGQSVWEGKVRVACPMFVIHDRPDVLA